MNCFYQQFVLTLRYEHEDIKSILDQFRRYDKIFKAYENQKAFLKKCTDKYPDRDYSSAEQELRVRKTLLDTICKIILVEETPSLWNAKIQKYNDAMKQWIQTVTAKPF